MFRGLKFLKYLALLAAASAAFLGCTASGTKKKGSAKLTIKGSDTMVILNQRWAEEFMKKNPQTVIQVTGGGSGTGIAALENESTDLASCSRPIYAKEKEFIEKKFHKEVVETPVAVDAITIYVYAENPIQFLTMDQLKDIFSGKTTNWKELGFKDAKIIVYSRENNSGTYAFFKEHVLKGQDYSQEASYLPGTAAVVNAIQRDPNGIGYGGIAYLPEGVKAIYIKADKNTPAIEPSLANTESGKYPLSRKLFYYSVGKPQALSRRFIDFALSPEGQKICQEVGYFPLKNDQNK